MNEKYRYLGKNTLIFAISSFGTKFLSFLLVPLYTNVLSTEEYGTADLLMTTSTLLIFVLTIDIADSVMRFSLERKSKQGEILSYGIRILMIGSAWCGIGLGLVAVTGLLSWPLYYYLFIFLFFFGNSFYQILTNYLRGVDKIRQVAVAGIISTLALILSNILFLLVFKIGIIGYLISLVFSPFAASIYCMSVIRESPQVYLRNFCDVKTCAAMRAYCIPLVFNNIALWINAFLDRYFVTYFCGVGENGIYSIASKIPTILATCYTVFSQAWNLSAIKEFDPEDKDGFFSQTYEVYNSFIVMVCSILILINIPLAKFLYAKEFFAAWQYSSILLLFVMFNSLTIIVGSIFSAVKKTKAIAVTTILSAITNTVLNIILIPVIGSYGAAIATAAAYLVMWAARLVMSRKYIKFRVNWIRDCVVYGILALQVVFEHMNGHMYLGQVACLIGVFALNLKQVMLLVRKLMNYNGGMIDCD